ncbi:MAG: SH3 domain-containing protein [Anaerolineae bacterium]|nr:SH3 domain-containing protein [Anaerolineae bacterium]
MKNTDWHNQRTTPTRRPRRLEEVSTAEVGVPIAWVIIGALAGLLVIGLVGLGVVNIVRKQAITPTPPTIPGLAPTQPVAAQATPEPQATPTIPPVVTLPPTPSPSPSPTETPLPVAPDELAPGGYAQVTDTEGAGLSLRAGPGTNNARLATVPEGSVLLILDGPRDDENLENYTWWFLRDADGTEGWAVQGFLRPSLPPPEQ